MQKILSGIIIYKNIYKEKVMKIFSVFFSIAIVVLLSGCTGIRPKDLGVKAGRLKDCPSSPNCVSTQASDPAHRLEPLTYTGTKEEAMDRLVKVINSMKRTKIITRTDVYLYAEFTSKIMRFVDDVEFYIDDSKKIIHFRSASRLGYSDLGVNRKRMDDIRKLFNR